MIYLPKVKGLKLNSINGTSVDGRSEYLDYILNNKTEEIISKIINEYRAIQFGGFAANQGQYFRLQSFEKGYKDFIEGRGSANDFFGLLDYTLEHDVKDKFSEEEIIYFKKLYKSVVK